MLGGKIFHVCLGDQIGRFFAIGATFQIKTSGHPDVCSVMRAEQQRSLALKRLLFWSTA
jgi:hypothetical protein